MTIILIALLTFLASSIGTMVGFGTSTTMVPVLVLFFPVPQTLLLVGIIHFFEDIWKLILFREGFNWKLILLVGLPGMVASYLGASLVFRVPQLLLSQILGGFFIVYVVYLAFNKSFKLKLSNSSAILGGSLSGFFAGIFGLGGAIRSAFLTAFDLPKEIYLATLGGTAIFIDTTRLTTYVANGVRLQEMLLFGLFLFIPVSLLGSFSAKRVVLKIPQSYFRLLVAFFLFLIGIKLILFPNV